MSTVMIEELIAVVWLLLFTNVTLLSLEVLLHIYFDRLISVLLDLLHLQQLVMMLVRHIEFSLSLRNVLNLIHLHWHLRHIHLLLGYEEDFLTLHIFDLIGSCGRLDFGLFFHLWVGFLNCGLNILL